MKVIVFGGAGFVGSHVADALTEAGHDVTLFDLRPSPYLQPGQKMVIGDILDRDAVRKAVEGHEVVYNFAGQADLDVAVETPIETTQLNVLGCLHQLEAARLAGARRFVFASSIYVCSEAGGFYRASKQSCELFVEEYERIYGLSYTILRYGTLYGRRADQRNSVHRYLTQALLDRRISVGASGEELREYIHVADAARSSVEILGAEFENQHVVLTGADAMRFLDLLKMIREIVGEDVAIQVNQTAAGSPVSRAHYAITPYSFRPRIAKKLVPRWYLDMGQGLVDCLTEIHQKSLTTPP